MKEIRVARISENAKLPTRKLSNDAGMDLYSLEAMEIKAHTFKLVHTGVVVEIPKGYVGIIKPKGGNTHLLGSGVVDAGYTGEIILRVVNPFYYDMVFEHGHPMGQMVILPVVTPEVVEVTLDDITEVKTERGATGGIHDFKQANFMSDLIIEERDFGTLEDESEG
jgi:dUTP pyrophosphatase